MADKRPGSPPQAHEPKKRRRAPRSAFRKGQSGNPKGSSARQRELADIKRLTVEELAETASMLLSGGMDELLSIKDKPDATILQIWVASLVVKSINKGNSQTFDVMMDRIIGKTSSVPYTRAMRDGDADADRGCPL